jgi:hypothetical protein
LPDQYQSLTTSQAMAKFQETYSIVPGIRNKPGDILDNTTLVELVKLECINASVFQHSSGFSFLRNKFESELLNEVFNVLEYHTYTINEG